MRMRIDSIKCDAYGVCADICPSLIELDDWGYAGLVDGEDVPDADIAAARLAIASCPENAIIEIVE